jgi:cytochrome c553
VTVTRIAAFVLFGAAMGGAALAQPQGAASPPKAEACAACHGPNGNSTQPQFPILAGQTSRYLYLQLRDFQEKRRGDPDMSHTGVALTRDEVHELADWFARQKPAPNGFKPDPEKVRLGKAVADAKLCTMCHLGGFTGQNEIPRVAGQHHDYVLKQLMDFKQRKRTNDAGNMTAVCVGLSEEDIQNLAHYLAGL